MAVAFLIFGFVAVNNGGNFVPWLLMFVGLILVGIGYMQRIAAK